LEFPELFLEEPGGGDDGPRRFDAVIGNQPYMGGFQVSGALGDGYRDWLLRLHEHAHGNADYAAHFLRRARALLGEDGAFGLITTNTVYQGDTRATGLQPLVRGGGVLYHATRSRPWPGEAAVTVSVVHAAFGRAIEGVARRVLDGRVVPVINSRLRPAPERDDPARLEANAGMSFLGSKIYGQGFILSPAERERLIARREENARRIVPYLGGEEINAHPRHAYHRYVISFGAMSLEEAARWPELLEIVRERVKPERDTNRRALRRRYWWRFGEVAPALYEAIRPLPRCLVLSRHSKHLAFTFVDPRAVFSEATQVFPITCDARFAVLQSRAHEPWARLLSSSLEDRLRYSASDCFETFPFPDAHALAPGGPLGAAGKALFEARARYMVETERGLTKTYNLLKDPARRCPRLQRLRALHESMDRAALAAYGWEDLRPPPITAPRSRAEARAREAFEDALLDRLFALNAARAAAERRRRGSA
ncbi:MAG: hypothetical protein KC468_27100, partial [Myxococcales bacterium]|nr:hypothetical protein [Myxococcales bacterium]